MLFGHQHNDASQSQPEPVSAPAAPSLNPLAVDPTTGVSLPVAPESSESNAEQAGVLQQPAVGTVLDPGPATPPPPPPPPTSAPVVTDAQADTPDAQAPAPVVADNAPTAAEPVTEPVFQAPTELPAVSPPAEEPVMPFETPEEAPESSAIEQPAPTVPAPASPGVVAVSPDDLLDLKQHALAELGPLVDQLDQTPEERFRTKMMLLQSTDDQTLIKDAYTAAQQITDEKSRAQALLDIVNEINYFTSLNKQA